MTTKEEAEAKIAAAEKLISRVNEIVAITRASLNERVSMNMYGIYQDHFEMLAKLRDAQYHIQQALKALEEIDWPTNADYDLYESDGASA